MSTTPGRTQPHSPTPPSLRERVQSLRLPPDDMLRRPPRWPWLLAAIVLLGGGYAGYRALGAGSAANSDAPPEQFSAGSPASEPPVGPAPLLTPEAASAPAPGIASSGEIALQSTGYIVPAHQIRVSPKVPGMLVELNIEEGQRVVKGDVLAQLETTDYEADRHRTQALLAAAEAKLVELERGFRPEEIQQAKAELEEAQAQLAQLQAEWQRISQLRQSGVATESEYDLAEANYRMLNHRVDRLRKAHHLMVEGPRAERIDAARAEVELAKAELEKANWRLDNCTIRAPVSGTILKKDAEVGNLVNPVAFAGSLSLCDMADLADLEVEVMVMERDIAKVFKTQRCKISGAQAWPDRQYDGYVARLMPIANRSQGAVPVRVKILIPANEQGKYLKPEMSALVTFLSEAAAAPAR